MSLTEVLEKFKLNDLESSDCNTDVYWEKKLISLLLQEVYIFPNDENSTRDFNDCISNEDIQVIGTSLIPGKRGIIARRDFTNTGEAIMCINPVMVPSFDFVGYYPRNHTIENLENVLSPYIDKVYPNLKERKDGTFKLVLRVYLTYLYDPHYRSRLDNLCTHQCEQRMNGLIRNYAITQQARIVKVLTEFLNNSEIGKSTIKAKASIHSKKKGWKFIEVLVYIVLINCNSLFDEDNEEIGNGLDPDLSLINHSCIPNCALTEYKFEHSGFQIINTLPIMKNEEITVTYIDPCLPRELRLFQLKFRYFFNCKCELCSNPNDLFFSYCCPWCHNILPSQSFTSFLLGNDPVPDPPTCSTCFRTIDEGTYTTTNSNVKYFIASILYCKGDFGNIDKEEHVLYLANKLKIKDKSELKNAFINIILNHDPLNLQYHSMYKILNQFIQDNIFPVYAYPLNKIVYAMDDFKEDQENPGDTLLMKLKVKLIRVFLVSIPSDLSHQDLRTGHVYLEISEILKKILELTSSDDCDNVGVGFLGILCQCGTFFVKQVTSISKQPVVDEYLVYFQQMYEKSSEIEKQNLDQQVNIIHWCLGQLLEFAKIRHMFVETLTEFKIYNAKRDLITVFNI
ncbi:hypothetical protein JA1_004165 [Spathaspora sp. JA1]|nr:hypothetical protein JA1_004165 [Spathaspora sp. JA1]